MSSSSMLIDVVVPIACRHRRWPSWNSSRAGWTVDGLTGVSLGVTENLEFKGPDIAGVPTRSGDSPLVCRRSGIIIGVIDRQAAWQQRVGLRWSSIVLQVPKLGVQRKIHCPRHVTWLSHKITSHWVTTSLGTQWDSRSSVSQRTRLGIVATPIA
jgi:hypothetical protein